jgi:sporulation protein YlmC with PRC-barrel domain
MHVKKLALALVASALLSTTALAQSNPPAATKPMESTSATSAQTVVAKQGQWRASKLIGVNVYNANNEKIGDINELITDSSGKIDLVVVGVGGFLGMGEHNVALPFSQIKWVNDPVKTSTTTAPRTTGTGTAVTTTTTTSANRDYPDHATVSSTKDQLKAMPAFKYVSDASTRTTTEPVRPAPAPAPTR